MRTPIAARWCWRRRARLFAPGPISATARTLGKDGQRVDRDIAVQHLYIEGNRLFRTKKPIIAAVHGAAVGGGLGLGDGGGFPRRLPGGALLPPISPGSAFIPASG